MEIIIAVILFIAGLVFIVKGGDLFVDSASNIAKSKNISPFIIGATIVSVATTLPEIIVSVTAAFEGKTDLAVGNGLGSVIANTGLVMAIALIAMTTTAERKHYGKQIVLLIATVAVLFLSCIGNQVNVFGIVALLAIFVVFMYVNLKTAKEFPEIQKNEKFETDNRKNILFFIVGAAIMVVGSRFLVDGGSEIALAAGIEERIVAIAMIAVGTCLPELVTTVVAITKKQSSLSVGNIIGANIIDLALILPLCTAASGKLLPINSQTLSLDLPFLAAITAIATIPLLLYQKSFRIQGVALLVCYAAYIVVLFV